MIRSASTTPAASASLPTSKAGRAIRSSSMASRSWRTSPIAARPGRIPLAGDGAGILVQIPHAFLKDVTAPLRIKLPEPGHYAVGHMFMPRNRAQRIYCESVVARVVDAEGLKLLGWRDVPSDNSCLSASVIETEPTHRQVFIGRGPDVEDENDFERRLYVLRKVISNTINGETGGRDIGFYTVSLSCRTLVYKGMFLAYQLGAYYPDLHHPLFASALALVHQRFSTNTFPSWKLAHPYRMVAHNGEINTLRGNLNWMAARQASVSSPLFGPDIAQALADLLRRPVRHRLLRQRARIPGAGRLQPRACGDDADPRGLGRQSADGCQAPRLLRISRLPDGAVGRPGGHGLHRRPPDRRHARPQRPPARALSRHRRRPRHHGVRNRRAADRREDHRREMAAAARQDAAHRPREGPHHLRRGDQGRARRRASLSAMARPHPDPRA